MLFTPQQIKEIMVLIGEPARQVKDYALQLALNTASGDMPGFKTQEDYRNLIAQQVYRMEDLMLAKQYSEEICVNVKELVCATLEHRLMAEVVHFLPEEKQQSFQKNLHVAFGLDILDNIRVDEPEKALWRERIAAMITPESKTR